jgi:hypothetical protein
MRISNLLPQHFYLRNVHFPPPNVSQRGRKIRGRNWTFVLCQCSVLWTRELR